MSPFVTTWGACGSPTLPVPPAGMAISRPPKAAAAVRHRLQQMVLPSRREPAALPTLPAHHRHPPQGSYDVERVQNTMPPARLPICHPSKGPPALAAPLKSPAVLQSWLGTETFYHESEKMCTGYLFANMCRISSGSEKVDFLIEM